MYERKQVEKENVENFLCYSQGTRWGNNNDDVRWGNKEFMETSSVL